MYRKHQRWLLSMVLLFCSEGFTQSAGGCMEQARTPLEQTYCKVKAVNPSAALPSLQELRRNPEKTQRLLLRRPAEQAGIPLPPEKSAPPAATPAAPKPADNAFVRSAKPVERADTVSDIPAAASLTGCDLIETVIRCGSERYQLQGNLPNGRLSREALDPAIPIIFEEYQGGAADQTELMGYATNAYRHYIESMLDIGLGAATMSLTKFYHTLLDAQNKGTRFGERMSEMFVFLKKDKAAMGVQSHYNDALPEHISQCMRLSDMLLVCDNVQQNWVYKRSRP